MNELYKYQFAPQKQDLVGPIFLDGICDNPQCKEDLQAISVASFVYDLYFAQDGIICGATHGSIDDFISLIDSDSLPKLTQNEIDRYIKHTKNKGSDGEFKGD